MEGGAAPEWRTLRRNGASRAALGAEQQQRWQQTVRRTFNWTDAVSFCLLSIVLSGEQLP